MYRDSRRLRLLLALLIAISFTLITVDYRAGDGTVLAGLRRGTAAVFGPVQRAVERALRPVGNALSNLGDIGGLQGEVDKLRADNADLRGKLREGENERRRLEEMDELLGLTGRRDATVVPARVIAVGTGTFEWTVTIDAGTRDGIRKDQTVVNGDGLVGRVLSAGPYTAQVLLANDAHFQAGARLAKSGELGIMRGDGVRPMVLTLLNAEAKVAKGDAIVTGGSTTFVADVPIGVVADVRRRPGDLTVAVEVTPYVRYTALDLLGVIVLAPREAPRPTVTPSPPARTQSPTPTPS